MFKRLPLLCAALLALAACSNNSDSGGNAAVPSAATTAATPAAAATTASSPAASAAAPASEQSAPTPASSAAAPVAAASSAPAPAPAAGNFVDNGKWVEGKNYFRIEPQQATSHPGKIEVTEVFSYGCPACNQFHATADQIAKELPSNAVMVYVPASFMASENWPTLQRAYLTALALGVADKAHDAMYDAIWVSKELSALDPQTGRPKPADALPTLADIAKFYAKYGANPQEFEAVANSFAINTQVKRADELVKAYGVEGTPTMVINGKYRFDVGNAGGYPQAIELTKFLVAKEAAGK